MAYALKLAKSAGQAGEVPVAAIITDVNGNIIAEAANAMHQLSCATALMTRTDASWSH